MSKLAVLSAFLAVVSVGALNTPIVFPHYGVNVNNPTCYGSRLDKVEFVQNMYVQYAEFMAPVPDLYSFHTCFWMRLDQTRRTSTAINYSTKNNTNNDVITLQYTEFTSPPSWILLVNGVEAYQSKALKIPQSVWTHQCHSWDGNTGLWSTWQDGSLVEEGYSAQTVGQVVPGGGILVTGQHQNTLGDGMDRSEGIIGGITLLHLHSKPIEDGKGRNSGSNYVRRLAGDCRAIDRGDVIGWLRIGRKTFGGVFTSGASEKCRQF